MREIYDFEDAGITDNLLDYFQKLSWKKDVKELNLSKNYISNADVLFQNLTNLQKLYLKNNELTSIKIMNKMNKLEILNVSENHIT